LAGKRLIHSQIKKAKNVLGLRKKNARGKLPRILEGKTAEEKTQVARIIGTKAGGSSEKNARFRMWKQTTTQIRGNKKKK